MDDTLITKFFDIQKNTSKKNSLYCALSQSLDEEKAISLRYEIASYIKNDLSIKKKIGDKNVENILKGGNTIDEIMVYASFKKCIVVNINVEDIELFYPDLDREIWKKEEIIYELEKHENDDVNDKYVFILMTKNGDHYHWDSLILKNVSENVSENEELKKLLKENEELKKLLKEKDQLFKEKDYLKRERDELEKEEKKKEILLKEEKKKELKRLLIEDQKKLGELERKFEKIKKLKKLSEDEEKEEKKELEEVSKEMEISKKNLKELDRLKRLLGEHEKKLEKINRITYLSEEQEKQLEEDEEKKKELEDELEDIEKEIRKNKELDEFVRFKRLSEKHNKLLKDIEKEIREDKELEENSYLRRLGFYNTLLFGSKEDQRKRSEIISDAINVLEEQKKELQKIKEEINRMNELENELEEKKLKEKFSILNLDSDYTIEIKEEDLNKSLLSILKNNIIPDLTFISPKENYNVIFKNKKYESYDDLIDNKNFKSYSEVSYIINYLKTFCNDCIKIIKDNIYGIDGIKDFDDLDYNKKLRKIAKIEDKRFYSIFFKKIQENTINYLEKDFLQKITTSIIVSKYRYEKIRKNIEDYVIVYKRPSKGFGFINKKNYGWHSHLLDFLQNFYENPDVYGYKEDVLKRIPLLGYIIDQKKEYDEEENEKKKEDEVKKIEDDIKKKREDDIKKKREKEEENRKLEEDIKKKRKKEEEDFRRKKEEEDFNKKREIEEDIKKKKIEEESRKLEERRKGLPTLKYDFNIVYYERDDKKEDLNYFLISILKEKKPSLPIFKEQFGDYKVIFNNKKYENYNELIDDSLKNMLFKSYEEIQDILDYLRVFYNSCIELTKDRFRFNPDLDYKKKIESLTENDEDIQFYSIFFKKTQENTINFIERTFIIEVQHKFVDNDNYKDIGLYLQEYKTKKVDNGFAFINNNTQGWSSYLLDFLQEYHKYPDAYEYKEDDFQDSKLLTYIKEMKLKEDENNLETRRVLEEEKEKLTKLKDNLEEKILEEEKLKEIEKYLEEDKKSKEDKSEVEEEKLKKEFSILKFDLNNDYRKSNPYYNGKLNEFLLSFLRIYIPIERTVNYPSDDYPVIFKKGGYSSYDELLNDKSIKRENFKPYLKVKSIIEYLIIFYNGCVDITQNYFRNLVNVDFDYMKKMKSLTDDDYDDYDDDVIHFYSIFFKRIQENTINYIEGQFLKDISTYIRINDNDRDYKGIGERIEYYANLASKGFIFINDPKNGWHSYILKFLREYYKNPEKYEKKFKGDELLSYIKEKRIKYIQNCEDDIKKYGVQINEYNTDIKGYDTQIKGYEKNMKILEEKEKRYLQEVKEKLQEVKSILEEEKTKNSEYIKKIEVKIRDYEIKIRDYDTKKVIGPFNLKEFKKALDSGSDSEDFFQEDSDDSTTGDLNLEKKRQLHFFDYKIKI